MSEEKQQINNSKEQEVQKVVAKVVFGGDRKGMKKYGKKDRGAKQEKKDEFDQKILDIARVTRVMAGGKRMRFRACVVIGDKKGKIGIGVAKGADVTMAVNKAVNKAKKAMIDVQILNGTIAHEILNKFGASKLIFKPSKSGRGIIAGGVVRIILEMSGIQNITSKILGTNNKLSNAKCTIDALAKIRKVEVKKTSKPEDKKEKEVVVEDKKEEDKKNINKKD